MTSSIHSKILIIEDDPGICNFLKATLSAAGYEPIVTASGHSALNIISSHCPDCILLDLGLPDMDGADIIRSVRSWTQTPTKLWPLCLPRAFPSAPELNAHRRPENFIHGSLDNGALRCGFQANGPTPRFAWIGLADSLTAPGAHCQETFADELFMAACRHLTCRLFTNYFLLVVLTWGPLYTPIST